VNGADEMHDFATCVFLYQDVMNNIALAHGIKKYHNEYVS
jgi:hypothetical protein